jgi:hypothetical protein
MVNITFERLIIEETFSPGWSSASNAKPGLERMKKYRVINGIKSVEDKKTERSDLMLAHSLNRTVLDSLWGDLKILRISLENRE